MLIMKLIFSIIFALAFLNLATTERIKKTDERIAAHGYPVETHTAQTSDGYILTMFRIPYSPRAHNTTRPAVLVIHGMLASSDSWILPGPDSALPYLLADAGYDVWLGNNRGNTYSKKNVNFSASSSKFWSFSWHEMGILDIPAMIDHILSTTKQTGLHYVGHSQGTTVFFVLLSEKPEYNAKIKTSYMLAPAVFMDHMQSPLVKIIGPYIVQQNLLTELNQCYEILPHIENISKLAAALCSNGSSFQPLCANLLFLINGYDPKYLNYTLLPDAYETNPADSSICQVIHYLQGYQSGHFRKFDFGKVKNTRLYGQKSPPDYRLDRITAPIVLFYGNNDWFVAPVDVLRLKSSLHDGVRLYNIPIKEWNHSDFLWSLPVKKLINDVILRYINEFEKIGGKWI